MNATDLNDPLAELFNAPAREPVTPPANYTPPTFVERCRRCAGTGRFDKHGRCFKCNGSGRQTFKTPTETRYRARVQKVARAANKAVANLDSFKAANPAEWAWMDGNTFGFAVAMREAVAKYGDLTDNQLAAVRRCVAKRDEGKAAAAARVQNAKAIDLTKITDAFGKASARLKTPKLRIADMVISPAKATSQNAGSLYVKSGETYLGKVTDGRFIRSRECTDAAEAKLLEAAADPLGAAVAYGRLTGNCACCGRQLTDPESVERGIGPVCAETFGF